MAGRFRSIRTGGSYINRCIMNEIILPQRYQPLNKVTDLTASWDAIKAAVRPEFVNDENIARAQKALSVGLNDAAINYFWNLTIYDLYTKIMAYGVEYFSTAINWNGKPLKSIDDLKEVKDYEILNGVHTLSIIPDESFFYLSQCREIRNHFSTAHYPMGNIDIMETCNFIKNCIKYALTHDLPAPGIQIRELMERISVEKIKDPENILAVINQQAQKVKGPIIHSFFKQFIKPDCDDITKHNIKLLAPVIWEEVAEDVKTSIGQKYASLKEMKDENTEAEALTFLQLVNGVTYIPESYLNILFTRTAKQLIDAHFGWDNFYSEPGYARDLRNLGSEIPQTSLRLYVKAVVVSFIGNSYGEARDAQKYNKEMLSKLNTAGVNIIFSLLENDHQVYSELTSIKPSERLQILMDLLKDKSIHPEYKSIFDYLSKSDSATIRKYFNKKYMKYLEMD